MAKLKISFKPLFIIYMVICLYFSWTNIIFFYVLAIALHEYSHYCVANKLGYHIDSVVFSISGAGLYGNCVFKEKDDIVISLAGPISNLIVIIILLAFWWVIPVSYLYTHDFLISNLSVMFFNLLPIYPLDGGRVLMSVLAIKNKDKNKIKKITLKISFVVGIVLIALFVISLFFVPVYNILIIGLFLTINSIAHDNNRYYSKILTYEKNFAKPVEIKEFIVSTKEKVELLKLLNPHYYSVFYYKDNDKFEKIEEKELIK